MRLKFAHPVDDSPDGPAQAQTRQRLLEAGGEILSEQGFHRATVREICERAGANVAAVNYHFRDKQGLYAEVLKHAHAMALGKADARALAEKAAAMPPEARLRSFIGGMLGALFNEGAPAWWQKLSAREMLEPTEVLGMLVEASIRPRSAVLRGILRELLGPDVSEEQLWRCTFSIVGQVLFYHHCRPVIELLRPEQEFTPEAIERAAEHIARFSLAGMRDMARSQPPARKGKKGRSR